MSRTHAQIVTELKRKLDAYLANPQDYSEEEVQALLREIDWSRRPEQPAPTPEPAPRGADAATPTVRYSDNRPAGGDLGKGAD